MVKKAILTVLFLSVAGITGAQDASTFEEIQKRQSQLEAETASILGEELIEHVQQSGEQAIVRYDKEVREAVAASNTYAQDSYTLAQDLGGAQFDAAIKAGLLPAPDVAAPDQFGDVPLRYRIFVSQRMPNAEVRDLGLMYAGRPDVAIVLRGMLPNQQMTDVHRWIYTLFKDVQQGDELPNILIDPEPFTELGVDQVPVIARYDDDDSLMAFALGITSVAFIEEEVSKGRSGSLGAFGPTVQVGEVDMIQALMDRAERQDWSHLGDHALDNYWRTVPDHGLPRVIERRTLTLDPTIEVGQTITTPDGTVLAYEGDRINPLDEIPFTRVLAFFNPGEADQVQWLQAVVAEHGVEKVTAMASQLQTLDGLEALGAMAEKVGVPIYMLPPEVRQRFEIERVPTLVWAEGNQFVIQEQMPSDRPEN